MISILFILVVLCLGGFIFDKRHRMNLIERQRNLIDRYLYRLRHFVAFKQYIGIDGCSGIAIDERRKLICLVSNNNGTVKGKIFEYKDIIASKIVVDGKNIALHIGTRDEKLPNFIVYFINSQIKQDSSLYKIVMEQIRYWHRLMNQIIERVKDDEQISKRNLTKISAGSIVH